MSFKYLICFNHITPLTSAIQRIEIQNFKTAFISQNRLAIEFVTVIAEIILSVAEIFPLCS